MTNPRMLHITVRPSRRLLRACCAFGLMVRRSASLPAFPRRFDRVARAIDGQLAPGGVALILGMSGSGKSTLLRALEHRLRRRGAHCRRVVRTPGARSVIDTVPGPLEAALGALARAGLADATLLGRRACELSEGERFRLDLAAACARGSPGATLLCDEFTSGLDRRTAWCVCAGLRRWATMSGGRVVCATVHNDVSRMLTPDVGVLCTEDAILVRRRGDTRWIPDTGL
jgi:ABC-type ATPase with predicted acetyltransferase domain